MSADLGAVLAGLDRATLSDLADAFEARTFPDRSVILSQGSTNSALFLLRRGSVAVRIRRGGQRETIAELMPRNFFGELSFLIGRACSADVEAVGPVDVAVISSESLAVVCLDPTAAAARADLPGQPGTGWVS